MRTLLACRLRPPLAPAAYSTAVRSRHGRPHRAHSNVSLGLKGATAQQSLREQEQAADLLQWVTSTGGVVHPSLIVTENAPCGCRGVIAAHDITISSCGPVWQHYSTPPNGPNGAYPLIAVPEPVCMTDRDAVELLSQAIDAAPNSAITKGVHHSSSSSSRGTPAMLQRAVATLSLFLHSAALVQHHSSLKQRLRQLQPPMLLALLLAHQRRLGSQSFWHAYISNLPDRPPCAWYDDVEQQLTARIDRQQYQRDTTQLESIPAVSSGSSEQGPFNAATAAIAAKCRAAADVFGAAIGGITAVELAWAYGQVVSRAFATGGPGNGGIALLPVIDLLNHSAGAAVPVCWQQDVRAREGGEDVVDLEGKEGTGRVATLQEINAGDTTAGDCLWCVWHQQLTDWDCAAAPAADCASTTTAVSGAINGSSGSSSGSNSIDSYGSSRPHDWEGDGEQDGVILQAGAELYISYLSSVDATAALLSFGFIPPELQQAQDVEPPQACDAP